MRDNHVHTAHEVARFPYGMVGYVLMLIGFLLLGAGVFTLASGLSALAAILGAGMVVAYLGALGTFALGRRRRNADREHVYTSGDPLIPGETVARVLDYRDRAAHTSAA
ncbi:hypothetical protein QSJ18_17835 [Gordonia sp. ABSL1-1]|uniref:hypothetical protein n=1 Tax=Gordonia sp. ABSL1-1 TaxID=3053923 RepID=UPI00257295B3|nr:hypothetical protein [Gordonia sp. ABSL1-1]MDL9938611.1 hypothetical protein [Gordonia sp. ABSL1-1]